MRPIPEPRLPVRLRGHHFLCILTYRGLGYSDIFVANMSRVVARIKDGDPVVLHSGPDAICAGMTGRCRADSLHECTDPDILRQDELAVTSTAAVLGRDLSIAAPLSGADIATLRSAFRLGSTRAGCVDCGWKALCDGIAEAGFADTRL